MQTSYRRGIRVLTAVSLFIALLSTPAYTYAASYEFGATNSGYETATAAQSSGSVSCETAIFGTFTPYIYSGNLDSFDLTVSGASRHLPIAVTINDTSVDLRYVTIFTTEDPNTSRIHIDVPFPVKQSAVVFVQTLQITQSPPPTCVSSESFIVNFSGNTSVTTPGSTLQTPPAAPTVSERAPKAPTAPTAPATPEVAQGSDMETVATTTNTAAVSCETISTQGGAGRAGLIFAGLITLLALLLYVSVTVTFGLRLAIALGGTVLAILTLWYWLDSCRLHTWIPLVTIAVGLIVSIWAILKPESLEKHLPEWVVGE